MSMKKFIFIIFILLLIVLGLLWKIKSESSPNLAVETIAEETEKNLKITFLDIGQGDASFIEFIDGQQMLIDCGIDARILEALGRVMPYYDRVIDYLVVTHPDNDHYGGCIDVLDRFEVKNIIYNGLEKSADKFWQEFWQRIENENANYFKIEKLDVWEVASTTMTFYYPNHDLAENLNIPGSDKKASDNNTSIIFELNYLGHEILFTGDMEETLEKYLLSVFAEKLDSDILKVGHHGSATASSQEFLKIVSPKYAVISTDKNNKFGHPSLRILKRLERSETEILRTDLQGDIVCEIGEQISCQ